MLFTARCYTETNSDKIVMWRFLRSRWLITARC